MRNLLMLAGMIVTCISALFTTRTDARDTYITDEVQTKFADYYVTDEENTGEQFGHAKCVFRNGERFYCPQGETGYLHLGKPIETKSYKLIPIYNFAMEWYVSSVERHR